MLHLIALARCANSDEPLSHYDSMAPVDLPANYGAFLVSGGLPMDWAAFGISAAESAALDAQMFLILEMSLHSFSCCAQRSQHSRLVGFFLGASGGISSLTALPDMATRANQSLSVYSSTSKSLAIASGRASYTFGLSGPCLTVDTACSSSLVAVH